MPLIQPVNPKIQVDTPTSQIQSVEPISLVAAGAGGYLGWRSGFGQGYAARFLGGGIGGSIAEQLAGDGSGGTGLLKNRFARIGLGSAFGPTLAPNVANDVAVAGGAVLGANAPDAVKAASKAADSVMPGAGAAATRVGREAVQAAALGGGAVAGTKVARGVGRMAGVGLGALILGSAAHFIYPLSISNRPETEAEKAAAKEAKAAADEAAAREAAAKQEKDSAATDGAGTASDPKLQPALDLAKVQGFLKEEGLSEDSAYYVTEAGISYDVFTTAYNTLTDAGMDKEDAVWEVIERYTE